MFTGCYVPDHKSKSITAPEDVQVRDSTYLYTPYNKVPSSPEIEKECNELQIQYKLDCIAEILKRNI